jgi:propanediol utilization protein
MNDEQLVEQLVERVWRQLQASPGFAASQQVVKAAGPIQIELEASGRHIHVSREHADQLFGKGVALTPIADLSQPGQFVCKERIGVVGPKGEFGAVVILGPERSETQVEVSATDATTLGVKPPVRLSGDLAGTPGIKLVGPVGSVELDHGVMVAKRHIHMHPSFADAHGLSDRQVVSVRIAGERAVTFDNTVLRVSPNFATYMHIDYDEANACGFKKGMVGTILVA